jgi:hypothetical protein
MCFWLHQTTVNHTNSLSNASSCGLLMQLASTLHIKGEKLHF